MKKADFFTERLSLYASVIRGCYEFLSLWGILFCVLLNCKCFAIEGHAYHFIRWDGEERYPMTYLRCRPMGGRFKGFFMAHTSSKSWVEICRVLWADLERRYLLKNKWRNSTWPHYYHERWKYVNNVWKNTYNIPEVVEKYWAAGSPNDSHNTRRPYHLKSENKFE